MTRVLVTGVAGFIGSHLVGALLKDDYDVTVLDDYSTGREKNLNGYHSARMRIIRGDVRSARAVAKALDDVDAVVHLAAIIDTDYSVKEPNIVNGVNVGGTLKLLNECVKKKVERLVFASSTAVYGDAGNRPIPETIRPKPISPYAVTKLAGEEYCNMYSRTFGIETACLRFFNVYGPKQGLNGYAGVITKFMERVLDELPPIIYGDGEQTRDFIHVSDVVEACKLALEKRGLARGAINVGTGKPTKIRDLAYQMTEITGFNQLEPVYGAPRIGDIKHNFAGIEKASKLLGFIPRTSLRQGLEGLLHDRSMRIVLRT